MPLFHTQFFAQTLSNTTSVLVYLPLSQNAHRKGMALDAVYAPKACRTLYLLHGLHGSETDWIRKTNAERYAEAAGIALVMPSVQHSFYCDMDCGLAYQQYMTEELPRLIRYAFPVSQKREDTAIAGCSMGGYGAVKLALLQPEVYSHAFSFSGALDADAVCAHGDAAEQAFMRHVLGTKEERRGGDNDLNALAARCMQSGAALPQLYLSCGTEDRLCLGMNESFSAYLNTIGLPHTYEKHSGGHDWDFWDAEIKKAVDAFAHI